jgi:hypothetical protein
VSLGGRLRQRIEIRIRREVYFLTSVQYHSHRMGENENDRKTSLEFLNISSSLWVWRGLQAGLVKHAAMMPFYDKAKRSLFWTNPANTLTYQALDALEESCIVQICEVIQREFPDMTGELPFRRAIEILAHRNAISHPGRSGWRKEFMQKFHDENRHRWDLRGAIIWDLQKSINEVTKNNEFGPQNADHHMNLETAASLRQIWIYSMNENGERILPTLDKLLCQLEELKPKYIEMLEQYPDGRVESV